MITKRLFVLQIVLVLGFAGVFLMPKSPEKQPSGVTLDLPEIIGEWWGQPAQITDKERGTLGPDTSFARKVYVNGTGDAHILVTIVLSGNDMSRSIHRPERCMDAQGWINYEHSKVQIPLRDSSNVMVPTTRMKNWRANRSKEGVELKPPKLYNVTYYWFAGLTDLTGSHFQRMLIDNRDRLFKGYNQRWAYITVAAEVTKDFYRFGRDDKQTDKMLREFIEQIAPKIHGASLGGTGKVEHTETQG